MNTNIKQLRREAYRIWGINKREVVYDTPQFVIRNNLNSFSFKPDVDEKHNSWPRSYKLSFPDFEEDKVNKITVARVIMPIILYKKYSNVDVKIHAWYDMSEAIHNKMATLMKEKQKLDEIKSIYVVARAWDYFFGKKSLDYRFEVFKTDGGFDINLKI